MNTTIISEDEYLVPQWAGYNQHGNDYNGHMHFHHNGNFYRQGDSKRGFYCAAPLETNYDDNGQWFHICSDPIPYSEREV